MMSRIVMQWIGVGVFLNAIVFCTPLVEGTEIKTESKPEFPRQFVPADADMSQWPPIEKAAQQLLNCDITSSKELEQWLLDFGEVNACVFEQYGRMHVNRTCFTENEEYDRQFTEFISQVFPKFQSINFKLKKRFYDSSFREQLDERKYRILNRNIKAEIELFREDNLDLQAQDELLKSEFDKINGGITAELNGDEKTIPQLEAELINNDRQLRKTVWEAMIQSRLKERKALDELYDKMVDLRTKIAHNAGCSDYREYAFIDKNRFDYSPQDCFDFHAAIEKHVVPLSRKLAQKRKEALGVEKLRPWDMEVDSLGREPLKPFENTEQLVDGVLATLSSLDPEFGLFFADMKKRGNLDLENRKGKAPGGYCLGFTEVRRPFIFMNSVGLSDDINTLLHESGHAYHDVAAREIPLFFYRFQLNIPIEFLEVTSMSMELFNLDHLQVFYTTDQMNRYKREKLEFIIDFLPYMARVDALQHWVYTHPNHTSAERDQQWLVLDERFDNRADWSGYEEARAADWQRKSHFFKSPFYYVEYGIAQLGALQLWRNFKEDPEKALHQYKYALSLGGSHTLPELFKAAGAEFDLSEKALQPLIEMVARELDALPESQLFYQ